MKKFNIFNLFIIFSMIFSSCEGNKDMLMYDTENNSYVYFALPFVKINGLTTNVRMDSMEMSFAFQELGTEEYTFQIPVNLAGKSLDMDRYYRVKVVTEETTAIEGSEYLSIPEKAKFRAGHFIDTLSVTVYLSEVMKKIKKRLVVEILPSEDFEVGATENKRIILSVTNILNKPTWWTAWERYFGEFCQEKYQRWINQYPLPAEGKPYDKNFNNKQTPVYWDNMPTSSSNTSWYPITFMQISAMRTYFQNNVVYVDGDPNKGRVTIP